MEHVKYKPDLSGWDLETFEALNVALRKGMAEALGAAFEGDETYICFPVEWSDSTSKSLGQDGIGGPDVDDPLTVYLRVGIESMGEKPTYKFSLRDALARSLVDCAHDGSFSHGLSRLSEALRGWADEIDAARKDGGQ